MIIVASLLHTTTGERVERQAAGQDVIHSTESTLPHTSYGDNKFIRSTINRSLTPSQPCMPCKGKTSQNIKRYLNKILRPNKYHQVQTVTKNQERTQRQAFHLVTTASREGVKAGRKCAHQHIPVKQADKQQYEENPLRSTLAYTATQSGLFGLNTTLSFSLSVQPPNR